MLTAIDDAQYVTLRDPFLSDVLASRLLDHCVRYSQRWGQAGVFNSGGRFQTLGFRAED